MIPRLLQIICGLLLAVLAALVMLFGSSLFFDLPPEYAAARLVLGLVIEGVGLWVVVLGVRLVMGRTVRGGLMGPTALRVIAVAYAVMIIAAVWYGRHSHSWMRIFGALAVMMAIVIGLWETAKQRQHGHVEHTDDDPFDDLHDMADTDQQGAALVVAEQWVVPKAPSPHRRAWILMLVLLAIGLPYGVHRFHQESEQKEADRKSGEYAAYMAALIRAEGVSDPLDRCLRYPEMPGTSWDVDTTRAYCTVRTYETLTLTQMESLLAQGRASDIDEAFAGYLDAQSRHPGVLDIAFQNAGFNVASERARRAIDEWKRQSPESAYALAASGLQFVDAAQNARGTGLAGDTSRRQFGAMHHWVELAFLDLEGAVKRVPSLTSAYPPMIYGAAMDSDSQRMEQAAEAALRADSADWLIRAQLMNQAQDKWGGHFGGMENQRDEAASLAERNPLLRMVVQLPEHYTATCDCGYGDAERVQLVRQAAQHNLNVRNLVELAGLVYDSDPKLSVLLYSQAIRFEPTNVDYLRWRSEQMIKAGDRKGALDVMLATAHRFPEDNVIARELAGIYRQTGHIKEAEATFLSILERDPDDIMARGFLGDLYNHEAHQPEKAAAVGDFLIARHPEHAAGYIVRACYLMDHHLPGRYETIHYFLDHFGNDPRWASAAQDMRRYLAKHPESAAT